MAPQNEGYVDPDGLTNKDVKIMMTYLKSVDVTKLPPPDCEVMSEIYGWQYPSRSATSELSRTKTKIKKIQDTRIPNSITEQVNDIVDQAALWAENEGDA